MWFLKSTLARESRFNFREIFPESCALAAGLHLPDASQKVLDCLLLQEHRGEHSSGIVSLHEKAFFQRRQLGRIRETFAKTDASKELPGSCAIGHNRYATEGDHLSESNIQPLLFYKSRFGSFALAHNGNIEKYEELRDELLQEGVLFQSQTDSELLGHLIARAPTHDLIEAIRYATRKASRSFSLLLFHEDKTIALRDSFGVRPLSVAKYQGGFLICSENFVFDLFPQAEFFFDIEPGEMVVFDHKTPTYQRMVLEEAREHFCIFEGIYFSSPRSRYNRTWHEDFRVALGRHVFAENPFIQGDVVIPILNSGKHSALGFSEASGIPYKEYLERLELLPFQPLRSFTSPTQKERSQVAFQKLHLRKEKVQGQSVVVVDDSIVRATTMKSVNQRLREAGVQKITTVIAAPPIIEPCLYGMDFKNKEELIASANSIEQIRKEIQSDELIYLSLEGLNLVIDATYAKGTCQQCFGKKIRDGFE